MSELSYSRRMWLADQKRRALTDDASERAEKKRRAEQKPKRDLSFLVDDDVLHPIDPRDVRY